MPKIYLIVRLHCLKILPSKLLQLSVDGPNTNWSVLTMPQDDRWIIQKLLTLPLVAYMFSMVP